jgi:hypothetical protein
MFLFLFFIAIKKTRTVAKLSGLVIDLWNKSMERIIDGYLFESNKADFIRLRATETVTGHTEFSAFRPQAWSEVDGIPLTPKQIIAWESAQFNDRMRREDERKARSLENSARRAKTNVRHACKSINADTLLTLTYKENQSDLALTKRHLKEFARRMYRIHPSFVGVAGFERQKRGAWHVHLATVSLPIALQRNGMRIRSYDLIRSIWRSVVGSLGGNIDVSKRKRNSQRSPARIASYLSKYITKAFEEGEKHSNRWTKFGAVPKAKRFVLGTFNTMREAIENAYSLITQTQSVVTTFFSSLHDSFFIAAEPTGRFT